MTLKLGTNSGFVTSRPSGDPSATAYCISGRVITTTTISASDTTNISEVGLYIADTETEDISMVLYADDGGAPGELLESTSTQSISTVGWKYFTVDWDISSSTKYHIAALATENNHGASMDYSTTGGIGSYYKEITSFTDPLSGTLLYAGGLSSAYAIHNGSGPAYETAQNGSNSTSTSVVITLPSYSAGDLVVLNVDYWQNNNQANDLTWPSGPDSETVTSIETQYGENGGATNIDLPLIALGWYIATDDYAGGNITATADIGTRYANAVLIVYDGRFNATTPLSTATGENYSTSNGQPVVPAFSALAADADGLLFNFIAVDQDPFASAATNYTSLQSLDRGRASMMLAVRDTDVTSAESIGTATYAITSGDAWCAYGYIVRAVVEGFNMKVNIGDSWKEVASISINIGDTWKTVSAVKQNIGDTWKTVF